MAAVPPAAPLPAPRRGCGLLECPVPQTPDTRRCPPGHVPCASPSVPRAHSTASSPTKAILPTNAPSTAVAGGHAACGVPARLLFFGVLGEIRRRRGLGQHAGHD